MNFYIKKQLCIITILSRSFYVNSHDRRVRRFSSEREPFDVLWRNQPSFTRYTGHAVSCPFIHTVSLPSERTTETPHRAPTQFSLVPGRTRASARGPPPCPRAPHRKGLRVDPRVPECIRPPCPPCRDMWLETW